MIHILGTIFAVLLGLAFGSFLNVCLSRWPEGESVVQPHSFCRSCLQPLTWRDNIPLVSWLVLRGRCRRCNAWIGLRYPVVELSVGSIWGFIAWRLIGQVLVVQAIEDFGSRSGSLYAQAEYAIGAMILCWVLVGLAALDYEHFWLPDAVTLPGIVAGIAFYSFVSAQSDHSIAWEVHLKISLAERILAAMAAAGLILLIRWIYFIFRHREGIGLGDAKLMAMLGAWLGLESALLSFAIGVVLGALAATMVLSIARRNPEGWALTKLPLGTFLCVGGIVSALWGDQIIAGYRQWGGF